MNLRLNRGCLIYAQPLTKGQYRRRRRYASRRHCREGQDEGTLVTPPLSVPTPPDAYTVHPFPSTDRELFSLRTHGRRNYPSFSFQPLLSPTLRPTTLTRLQPLPRRPPWRLPNGTCGACLVPPHRPSSITTEGRPSVLSLELSQVKYRDYPLHPQLSYQILFCTSKVNGRDLKRTLEHLISHSGLNTVQSS